MRGLDVLNYGTVPGVLCPDRTIISPRVFVSFSLLGVRQLYEFNSTVYQLLCYFSEPLRPYFQVVPLRISYMIVVS